MESDQEAAVRALFQTVSSPVSDGANGQPRGALYVGVRLVMTSGVLPLSNLRRMLSIIIKKQHSWIPG